MLELLKINWNNIEDNHFYISVLLTSVLNINNILPDTYHKFYLYDTVFKLKCSLAINKNCIFRINSDLDQQYNYHYIYEIFSNIYVDYIIISGINLMINIFQYDSEIYFDRNKYIFLHLLDLKDEFKLKTIIYLNILINNHLDINNEEFSKVIDELQSRILLFHVEIIK